MDNQAQNNNPQAEDNNPNPQAQAMNNQAQNNNPQGGDNNPNPQAQAMDNQAQNNNPQGGENRPNPQAIRGLSFHHFHSNRSLGLMAFGPHRRPVVFPELRVEHKLRKRANCGRRGCDQLLFNHDGSLLFVTENERKMVRIVNPKAKIVGTIKIDGDWRIKEMMITGPNEVATSCISGTSGNASPCMKFWDVRRTRYEVSSSTFYGKTSFMSCVYSKKDDLFLTLDRPAAADRLATYTRGGFLHDSSDILPQNWSGYVKSIALSPDENILVMETHQKSYTVVRNLDLTNLFEDIQRFRPTFLYTPRQEQFSYWDIYNASGIELDRSTQYRNSPEVMFYETDSKVRMCPCDQSNKSVSFSPRSDFFAGHIESFKDEHYFTWIRRYPSRTVLAFDLLEHRIAQRRSQDPKKELHAKYARKDVNKRSYLNPPLCEKKINTYYGRQTDPLRPPYWQTPYEIPLLPYEARSYCSIGAGKTAVTTHCNQPLVALGDDRFYIKIYLLNEKFTLVQELKIDVGEGLRRFAFSPRDSSIVVSDTTRYLHWYDIEYKGPIVSEPMVSVVDQVNWFTNSCRIF